MVSRTVGSSRRFNALYDKPPDLAEFAQLLFLLLIPHVDDFGRMPGDGFTVKMTVLPASPRPVEDFDAALINLHNVQLIALYEGQGDKWLQINKFESHQRGLTKRTKSHIPPPPVKFTEIREIPPRARARNLTELNLTELNRNKDSYSDPNNNLVRDDVASTTSKTNGSGRTAPEARSKHPIFKGQRFVVFDWMLEDLMRILGPHTDDFDLHEWFFTLDTQAVKEKIILPKNQAWEWLQARTIAEAQRRGLSVAATHSSQTLMNLEVAKRFAKGTL